MKAVILVGGLGTRLRPLTCNTPKPMIPLVNQPFIVHVLENLRNQGIDEVILCVQYLADRFREALGDGSVLGLKIHVIEEPEPLGTAGAVKNVEHMLDGSTFVFNGDVLTDLDLRAMLAFHRERGSKLTIALTPVEDPTAYGLVEMDETGHIRRFMEKPRVDEITSNLINAGTYIIEPELFRYVPPKQHYMFERGLFPVVLQTRDPMYGYPSPAYWTDIGTPSAYLEVHHDILVGKVRYRFHGKEIGNRVWLVGDADIHPRAQVIGPVVIGPGVKIGAGAQIIGPTVIGAGCVIGAQARIEGAVLWENNQIAEGVALRSCVVGSHNQIGARTHITDGAVVGDSCIIEADNRLERGIRIWPETHLKERSISF
ncbi:nucleotidyltransferase family protein [Roseiflexus castenholzii]|jgi:mannose-1-phosphate guanylyltransferase|uniref:Nucleotidyl transferase n=1 Tax=Roseiflexus castenholzii (strain DSM 13941 / HLO8) TaxID=383372 RepID=A7NP37_ROSCS|nr:NDP-sugar synthase [Roseiflexus castenholzii]ABU59333.1 Nucleotidyl transferase [Roseiflexus castenholzii DSM 13941]